MDCESVRIRRGAGLSSLCESASAAKVPGGLVGVGKGGASSLGLSSSSSTTLVMLVLADFSFVGLPMLSEVEPETEDADLVERCADLDEVARWSKTEDRRDRSVTAAGTPGVDLRKLAERLTEARFCFSLLVHRAKF